MTAADDGNRCKVVYWYPDGSDVLIQVRCWHKGWFNAIENSPFNLTYVNQQNILGLAGHESGYAWADQPGAAGEYTPHVFYQYTSSGYQATAARSFSTGSSLMTFTGVNLYNGNVQVTAYGYGQEFCAVNYWSGSNAQVQCYDWDGTPIDTYYTIAFTGM